MNDSKKFLLIGNLLFSMLLGGIVIWQTGKINQLSATRLDLSTNQASLGQETLLSSQVNRVTGTVTAVNKGKLTIQLDDTSQIRTFSILPTSNLYISLDYTDKAFTALMEDYNKRMTNIRETLGDLSESEQQQLITENPEQYKTLPPPLKKGRNQVDFVELNLQIADKVELAFEGGNEPYTLLDLTKLR